MSTRRLYAEAAGLAAVVFAGGWAVAGAAGIFARQTGLGGTFVGSTLVAGVTSMPELSTTIGALRIGAATLAISNVFGGNAFDLGLLFLADLVYRDGPILVATGPAEAFAAASWGVMITCVFLWGVVQRRDRTVWRFGLDSLCAAAVYVGGLVVLYRLGAVAAE